MSREAIEDLIKRPRETRNTEYKQWFLLREPKGQAKLIKSLLALRNFDGGYLIIGIDDKTGEVDSTNEPSNVASEFHTDIIQGLVSKFASETFDIEVTIHEKDGARIVAIKVPSGVRSPVAAKSDLRESGNPLIATNDVYFRTLASNLTVSSAKIPYKDWPEITEICLGNREADIGSFIRRHLNNLSPNFLSTICSSLHDTAESQEREGQGNQVLEFLDQGFGRFNRQLQERSLSLPTVGSFDTCMILEPAVLGYKPDREFLRLLDISNPDLTGWPIWLDSSNWRDKNDHPYIMDEAWEALIFSVEGFTGSHIDFMRKEPTGRLYLWRALEDDLATGPRAPEPLSEIDFGLVTLRVAETIAVSRAFARILGASAEQSKLKFGFRWKGLKGRVLSSWANPGRSLHIERTSRQDDYMITTEVPFDESDQVVIDSTYAVTEGLFRLFDGFELSKKVNDDLVSRLLQRRL